MELLFQQYEKEYDMLSFASVKIHIHLEKNFNLPYNDRKIAKGAMKNDSSCI